MIVDKSIVGCKSEVYEFEIEKGAIRAFARAIGDDNPIYHDETAAKEQGYRSLIAPPTFPMTLTIPKPGLSNMDKSRTLHGGQEFIYKRPIVAGDILRCVSEVVDVFEKDGKNGEKMLFIILETKGEDLEGEYVFSSKTTIIYR